MKRDAESTWASERVENALLRERINDVAAEVARLTAALEGPGSTIVSMLAVDAPALGQGGASRRTRRRHQRQAARGARRRHGFAAGKQDHARRPHPRAAIDRLAGGFVELSFA